jgi:hypothetical protein
MTRILMVMVWSLLAGTQQPPRDTTAITPTAIGTASVSGRVGLGDDANTPVRRAVVTLTSTDARDVRSAITDDDGRFTIGSLPDGRYSLTAKKPAHITSAYGARQPGRTGTTLVVGAGRPLTGLEWSLPRGGVLAGRITLSNGEPASNAPILAIADRHSTSGGMISPSDIQFRTDDRGEFRVYGLPPDRYLLAVVPEYGRGDIAVRREGDYDTAVRTLQQAATSATAGVAVGTSAPPPVERTVGLAPTYFPGTPIASDAARITIGPGDVKDGLDFVVGFVPVATLRGTVVGTNGQPTQAVSISPQLLGPAMPIGAAMSARASRPDAKGQFTITGLTPGRYTIRARSGGVTFGPGGTVTVSGATQTEWALEHVTVHGDDIEGFSLIMRPGLTFVGRITTTGPGEPPATWKGASVSVQPVASGPGNVLNAGITGPRSATAGDDGTFTVTGLEPGDYEIRVTLPASMGTTWTLASVQHGNRDLRDAPLTFSQGSISDVAIVLTTERTELAGTLTSEAGTPATDYYVVAFPADRSVWHPASPRVRVMRPAADGLFSTRDLPPGTYRLAALTDVEDDEHRRAEFLESLYEASIAVTIAPAAVTRQDIRIR